MIKLLNNAGITFFQLKLLLMKTCGNMQLYENGFIVTPIISIVRKNSKSAMDSVAFHAWI
jgi:hypothetical protein